MHTICISCSACRALRMFLTCSHSASAFLQNARARETGPTTFPSQPAAADLVQLILTPLFPAVPCGAQSMALCCPTQTITPTSSQAPCLKAFVSTGAQPGAQAGRGKPGRHECQQAAVLLPAGPLAPARPPGRFCRSFCLRPCTGMVSKVWRPGISPSVGAACHASCASAQSMLQNLGRPCVLLQCLPMLAPISRVAAAGLFSSQAVLGLPSRVK